MLDASAASLLLGPTGAGDFVQVGESADAVPTADPPSNVASSYANTPPSAIQFQNVTSEIFELGLAQLGFQFEDPDVGDTHTVEIDWGDGVVDIITLQNNEREFNTIHRYLDDTPTGPTEVPYSVQVKIVDSSGGIATAETEVLVKNLAPRLGVLPVASIDEGGLAQLRLFYFDRGILDTQTIEVDWGDGTVDTFTPPLGNLFLSTNHQYLDDIPTGPAEIAYSITVTITDDDGGMATAATSVLVKNVAPSNINIDPVAMIDENSFAQLTLTFDDPGALDSHTIEIDWGDGTTSIFMPPVGERLVFANHQYLDDIPTGPAEIAYPITVKITDDDGGMATAATSVLVKNVAPSNINIDPVAMIDENSFAQLTLTFDDPGALDSHTIEIDWGDGSTSTFMPPVGERLVFANHQYLDDIPTGPAEIAYPITVKITDDDGGMATAATSVLVKNVAPTIDSLFLSQSLIEEGNSVTVSGTYSDVSILDTHTVTIQWGDGTSELATMTNVNGAGSFVATHFYADNDTVNPDDGPVPDNLYTIAVTAADDDAGETTKTIDLTVLNISPTLDPIIEATDVNSRGETYLTIRFADPGADTLTVYVDWGDVRDPSDPSMRALQPFVIDLTGIDGPGTYTVTLMHTYSGPPDPNHPAADIDLYVFVADDDFGDAVIADGQSEIRMATIKNPGIGDQPVYIDTTPQVPRLVFPSRTESFFLETTTSDEGSQQSGELAAAAGDTNVTTERFFELRRIDSQGNVIESHRLKPEVLNDLPALFRTLPDNHYEIVLVHSETNTRRLVIAFDVRNGEAIDPGDDSDGTRDRPPTDEGFLPSDETPTTSHSSEHNDLSSLAPTIVGLAASQSFRSWAEQVDRTVAQAGRQKWQQLRLRKPNSRKNR